MFLGTTAFCKVGLLGSIPIWFLYSFGSLSFVLFSYRATVWCFSTSSFSKIIIFFKKEWKILTARSFSQQEREFCDGHRISNVAGRCFSVFRTCFLNLFRKRSCYENQLITK